MRKWIIILHFQPLEFYPPVTNFLNYIADNTTDIHILVLTTNSYKKGLKNFKPSNDKIVIKRLGGIKKDASLVNRLFNYLYFNIGGFLNLFFKKKISVLYYETLSAYPAYLFKRYINNGIKIFIHYHEYTSQPEYVNGMWLNRFFHKREEWLYKCIQWISHTNTDRLIMFKHDEGINDDSILHVLPNYPPRKWGESSFKKEMNIPLKIVYVGALGMDTMYVEEFAKWVQHQQGQVIWDIYSLNILAEAGLFLHNFKEEGNINLYEGVSYDDLPSILRKYDVGVILYKGHIPNYIYNAPNKFFEYLACGLNVWYPDTMTGIKPYKGISEILELNFNALDEFCIEDVMNKKRKPQCGPGYFAENVLAPLYEKLKTA